ncbi:MAG TPA: hypothetical protein VF800_16430 [Telluria sp.]|jgi:hypothetical protein
MKINTLLRLGTASLLCQLSACTTELNAIHVTSPGPLPHAGAPYNLSFSQYTLNVTRRVHSCFRELTPKQIKEQAKLGLPPYAEVAVKTEATATKAEARDPKRSYLIDMTSLQSFFKSSDVKVGYYDSGAIKTVNAEAEDKAGEFASGVVSTLGKLVVLGGGLGIEANSSCTREVAEAVKRLASTENELATLTEQISVSTEQLKQYTALATALGRALPQADRVELSQRVRKLIDLQIKHEKLKNEVKRDVKLISVTDEVQWPPDGDTLYSDAPVLKPVDAAVLKRWTGIENPPFARHTALYLKLESPDPLALKEPCIKDCPDSTKGLKYRIPATGTLQMCKAGNKSAEEPTPFQCMEWEPITKPELISQLGRVFVLPLKSTLFSKKTVSASFAENGMPTSLGTGSSAAADKAAATFGGIADAAIAAREGRTASKNTELEAKIKHIKLQQDYQAALGPKAAAADNSKQDTTALFTVDTALLNAELANIEARKALADVKNL